MSNIQKKILFADDDDDFRFTIKEYFNESPLSLDFAENGVVALDKALANKYDLIILDINMPFMKGNEAVVTIKKKWPAATVIAFTAITDQEKKNQLINDGFDEVISKPIELRLLHSKIMQILTPELYSNQKTETPSQQEALNDTIYYHEPDQKDDLPSKPSEVKEVTYLSQTGSLYSPRDLKNKSQDYLIKTVLELDQYKKNLLRKIRELELKIKELESSGKK